jgi:hypothetical protein
MDLAAAANKVVQELMAKAASSPLLGALGDKGPASRQITSPTDTPSSGTNKHSSQASQPPGKERPTDSSSGSSSSRSGKTSEQVAADVALARDLVRKHALEAVLGSEYDFSGLFTVDEGSPQGRPVPTSKGSKSESEMQTGGAGPPQGRPAATPKSSEGDAAATPPHAQQKQQQKQQQEQQKQKLIAEEEDLEDDSPTRKVDEFSPQGRTLEPPLSVVGADNSHRHADEPAASGERTPAAGQGPQEPRQQEDDHRQAGPQDNKQQEQSGGEQPSTARPDSLTLAVSFHKHLVQAAARLSSGPAGVIADAQTDAQVDQLVRLFSGLLPSLSADRRGELLRLAPEAATAVFSDGAKGSPVVRLDPALAWILAPNDAAQLEAVLTTQAQDIYKHSNHQVGFRQPHLNLPTLCRAQTCQL